MPLPAPRRSTWIASLPVLLVVYFFSALGLTHPVRAEEIPPLAQQHQATLQDLQSFAIQGRMAVQYDAKGYSCQVHWHKNSDSQQISLISPLGNTLADIQVSAQGVLLISQDGKQYAAPDAEQLTQQLLGWPLPLSQLHDWILGRPSSGAVSAQEWDAQGRLQRFKQNDWSVEYADYRATDNYALPGKLTLRHPNLYLRLIVDEWQTLPTLTP
jgi:outer membrane lipoprotein LolB